jgi:hypothetical protein
MEGEISDLIAAIEAADTQDRLEQSASEGN